MITGAARILTIHCIRRKTRGRGGSLDLIAFTPVGSTYLIVHLFRVHFPRVWFHAIFRGSRGTGWGLGIVTFRRLQLFSWGLSGSFSPFRFWIFAFGSLQKMNRNTYLFSYCKVIDQGPMADVVVWSVFCSRGGFFFEIYLETQKLSSLQKSCKFQRFKFHLTSPPMLFAGLFPKG